MVADDLSGQIIRGYELRDQLGKGGFGAVYTAYQPAVGREVAVKIILPHYANHPDFIRRFEVEAQLVARLEHPYIVPLYDFWRDPSGAYLVMRKLGSSLRGYLQEHGAFDLRQAQRFLDQIAAALAVAHRAGVVHRDLKPDNMLLDDDGNIYLTDFSIAKDLGAKVNITQDGTMLGSPAYLAPEQIRAEPITIQSDIYTLGIVLFEVLAGRHPFDAETTPHALIYKHIQDPMPSITEFRPGLSAELDTVLQRATAKLPEERYADTLSLATAFRAVAEDMLDDGAGKTPAGTMSAIHTRRFTSVLPGVEIDNPYKGLRPFQEADTADFFGREALTTQLLARLREDHDLARFLALVGPSGSGKSSVVHAGLVPALRAGALPGSGDWFVADLVPGAHPLEELEIALLQVAVNQTPGLMEQLRRDERGLARAVRLILPEDDELLLVIDHFEEVFTLAQDADEVRRFLDLLYHAVTGPHSRVRVLVMLRADFYDRPLMVPGFSDLMRQRTEVVVPLSPDELERAIVGPAQRVGAVLETGLAAAIVADINEQPGALPMLQYALTELFDHRNGNVLTLDAYHEIGGTLGALARRADEVYAELNDTEREAARQLFLRLVTLGEGTEDTRRRVLQSTVLQISQDADAMRAVIKRYGASRLLTFDNDPATREPTIEVAHEALIREWQLLGEWLAQSRDDLRMEQRLTAAAREWETANREQSFLATGSRLAQFEEWAASTTLALNQKAETFLQASLAEHAAREAAEAARQAHEAALERRSRDRMRALVIVLAVGLLVAGVLAVVAINQQQFAEEQQRRAEANAAVAATAAAEAETQADIAATQANIAERNAEQSHSLALASNARQALQGNNSELAIILALEAIRTPNPLAQVVRTLAEVLYSPATRLVLRGHTEGARAVAYSPDGRYAVSGAIDFSLILWDVATGEALRHFAGHTAEVRSVAFSPDGALILSGSWDNTTRLWDVATGEVVHVLQGENQDIVHSVAFSPDGRRAISGLDDRSIRVWDVATGEQIARYTGHTGGVYGAAYSPDGTQIVTASEDESVRLWDAATGEALRRFDGHTLYVYMAVFSPDGRLIASAGQDTTVRLWDAATGAALGVLEGHQDWVRAVAFSPDGRYLLSASDDRTIRLWDVATQTEIQRFTGHTNRVYAVAFSPDGSRFISGSHDTTLRVWDVESGALARRFGALGEGHTGPVHDAVFSPDGTLVASAGADHTIVLWDAATGEPLRRLGADGSGHSRAVTSLAFSPDGARLLSGSEDRALIWWEVATGTPLYVMDGHNFGIVEVAVGPDGTTALSGSRDRSLRLWDLASGDYLYRVAEQSRALTGIAYSPDGRQALTASGTDTIEIRQLSIRLWDIETREELLRMDGHEDLVTSVAFSPDGALALSGSADRTLILWDLATGTPRLRLEGHAAGVTSVAFSPDGQRAVSGAQDGAVRIWDLTDGTSIIRLAGHTGPVASVAFSPDDAQVLSSSLDGTVRLWEFTTDANALLAWGEANRYVRAITCQEREQYRVEPLCD